MIHAAHHLVNRALGLGLVLLSLALLPLSGISHAQGGAAMDHQGAVMAIHATATADHPATDGDSDRCRILCLGLVALQVADRPLPRAAIRPAPQRPAAGAVMPGETPAPAGRPPKTLLRSDGTI